jgi:hypothetical protein
MFFCQRCGSMHLNTGGQCSSCGYENLNWQTEYGYSLPRQYPHQCPCCKGTGLVSIPPGVAGDQETFTTSESGPWPCRVCDGKGILWHE